MSIHYTQNENGAVSDKRDLSAFKKLEKKPAQYTIFLVDDDVDDRMQAMKELKKSPYVYNVHSFESGDKLMAYLVSEGFYSSRLMQQMPTLVILDIHMPGTDGIEILRDLKEHPLTKDIPVIMATSDASSKSTLEAYQLQANAYIPKPIKLGSIHNVIVNGSGWPVRKPAGEV